MCSSDLRAGMKGPQTPAGVDGWRCPRCERGRRWFWCFLQVVQSCLTLWDPMDYTVRGILQARILEWVACLFSRVLYLEFPFLPLIWREVPYPPRPCSSATRSLKLFLFSFPAGINSPIFSAPQNFTPILLQHSHCLPGRFGCLSAFPT